MIDDLIIQLLQRYEKKVSEGYEASFDHYVKIEFPRSYKFIEQDLKYWKEKQQTYEEEK